MISMLLSGTLHCFAMEFTLYQMPTAEVLCKRLAASGNPILKRLTHTTDLVQKLADEEMLIEEVKETVDATLTNLYANHQELLQDRQTLLAILFSNHPKALLTLEGAQAQEPKK